MNTAKPAKARKNAATDPTIARNKRAQHDYHLEQRYEAGMVLLGWELKSIRAGKAQLVDSYVLLRDGEAWLLGANITPLDSASTHVIAEPQRTRKLLLNARELAQLFQATQQKGYTCVATRLYWKGRHVKCEIALAKGKQSHDKRDAIKDKDWARQKERLMKGQHR
ncbi:MAG: SsrA-binding protein SmpB [Pseudomonadales bacterium]|nr:SsrA-binding protein SmpB [Pseudomonadales bacterium]